MNKEMKKIAESLNLRFNKFGNFKFVWSYNKQLNEIEFIPSIDLDYYLTIGYSFDNPKNKEYSIVATHKMISDQQIKIRTNQKFIENSLVNLSLMGF